MGPIVTLIDRATSSITPGGGPLPSGLILAAHILNRIHWIWCWHVQYVTVYTNSDNLKKYMGGCLLNSLAGNSSLLRGAAQVVLATRRILDCGRQKGQVYQAWQAIGNTWNTDYEPYVSVRVSANPDQAGFLERLLENDAYTWVETHRQIFALRTRDIWSCVKRLFWELLQLSVCYRLVVEAFSLNADVRTAAVNELFVHTSHIFEDLSGNRKVIHAELLQNRRLIQQVIHMLGIDTRAETLIDAVGSTLSVAESAYSSTSVICNTLGSGFRDGIATLLYTSLGWTPDLLLPKPYVKL